MKNPRENTDAIMRFLDKIVDEAVPEFNKNFAFRRLAKRNRSEEPLPTAQRQLSSYRTRLGTMIEYAISSEIDAIFKRRYEDQLSLTFAVAHEYPDFYLRGSNHEKLLRIEMKTVDCESDEQAARFDAPTHEIDPVKDFVLFMGWEWKKEKSVAGVDWEHPLIFSYVLVPSIEIAKERDVRLFSIGGKIENGKVIVPSTKERGKMVSDPGNYGKFWRIVKRERQNAPDLSPCIKKFLQFLKCVDDRAPRKRMGKYNRGQSVLSA
ncbi:hypothetical protein MUP77_08780 [Candidatus Bathyarchaeota archaeon]|nr:hypothetical protein [Candidatus Bathyarchaeota archaeon]